jgi:hypothetical protein
MQLQDALAGVRSLEDLPAVLAAVGQGAEWELLPPAPWLEDDALAARVMRAAVVARLGAFRWYGLEAKEAGAVTRRVARRLATRGCCAGVVGLDPLAGVAAFAATTPDAIPLLVVPASPSGAALASLGRLRGLPASNAAAACAEAAEYLGGEAVGHRFFERFRDVLERMAEEGDPAARAADRRQLALIQLTRVLFLYFVQAKGWLDARPDFLRREVDACLATRRPLHRHLLRPLFFGTLNRPIPSRGRAARFGRIPYLNGGLFEPHPLERRYCRDFPDSAWQPAFDDLFERFHFTVQEGTTPGAIAPDMLGRVFEGVMAPERRRASGTFYTPPRLVGELLDASFAAFLARRCAISEPEAAARLEAADPGLCRELGGIAVLDPAVGSGAFLLGALERLARWQARRGEEVTGLKRRILASSLFGVDLDPMAVRLTELRLWLAVIADDSEPAPESVRPLPNLDALVRQGDSLRSPHAVIGEALLPGAGAGALVAELRHRLFIAAGDDKRQAARALRRAETAAARESLDAVERRLEAAADDCLAAARSPTLFGGQSGFTVQGRAELGSIRRRLVAVRSARRSLLRQGTVPWFQYEAHFADVFSSRGGFDLVVGNPPWVRAEQLPPALRSTLGRHYRWWRSAAGARGFRHQPDLAVAFLERATTLAAPGGVIGFLLPAKLATAEYATRARAVLAEEFTLHAAADLTSDSARAFDAAVYPMALVISRARPAATSTLRPTLDPGSTASVPQRGLGGGAPWILLPSAERDALAAFRADHPTVADYYAIQLGVKTGANEIFLDPEDSIEPSMLRWAVRGRDLRPFRPAGSTRLLWTHDADGRPLDRLPPAAAAYLARYSATLRARTDYAGGPPWTLFRTGGAVAPHRVVWSDLARRLEVATLSGPGERERIPLNSCYLFTCRSAEESLAVTGWLNSSWCRAAARAGATPARGGFCRFDARTIGGLPLVSTALADPALVTLAMRARQPPPGADVQEQLDELCAAHLGLSSRARNALRQLADSTPHRG